MAYHDPARFRAGNVYTGPSLINTAGAVVSDDEFPERGWAGQSRLDYALWHARILTAMLVFASIVLLLSGPLLSEVMH